MEITETIKALLNGIRNGALIIDTEGSITFCNQAAKGMLGLKANLTGLPVKEVFPNTQLLKVIEMGEAEYEQRFTYENKSFLADRVPLYENGNIVGAMAILQETTQLEYISSELATIKELNRELNGIIESSYDGILILDSQGYVLRVNKSLERLTGLKAEEFVGQELESLYQKGVLSYQPIASQALTNKQVITRIQTISTGKELVITGTPIFDEEGNVFRVLSNVRDITELRMLKEELEQSKKLADIYRYKLREISQELVDSSKIIARSSEMKKVLELAFRAAQTEATVLVLGETGVGKGVLAQCIHNWSRRSESGIIIKINCSAIPKELIESELFGYEKGAFTGAVQTGKRGLFELADQGTLFLDEIADLPLEMQGKLLRVLEDQEIRRVGGIKSIKVNVRLIAATNKDLEAMTARGEFRKDLYYRLNVIPILIPPLRERYEEIPVFLGEFLNQFNKKYQTSKYFTTKTIDVLQNYHWPGNVRELENLVERLVITSLGESLEVEQLPENIRRIQPIAKESIGEPEMMPIKQAVEELEVKILLKVLSKHGTLREIGEILGISHTAVAKKIRKYKLEFPKKLK